MTEARQRDLLITGNLSIEPEMQLLRRNISLNLAKYVVTTARTFTETKFIPPQFGIIGNKLSKVDSNKNKSPFLRQYASGTNPQNLPTFPVQPLKETLEKFLKTAQPHLTEDEFKQTCEEANKFLKGDGAKLQGLLEKEAGKSENWLAERWLKAAYLQYRDPVCVFSSPGMAFPPQKFSSDDEFLQYTAKATFVALKYKELIDEKKIPLEKAGDKELDMSQYKKVFGTCRIPGIKEDGLEYNPTSRHVAVVFKGNWWSVPVYSSDCKVLHPEIIYKQLKSIFCGGKKKEENPIGILSSNHRDEWGKAYCDLISDSQNKASVEEIQKSLFTVSLDDEVPVKHGDNDKIVVSEQLIHGGGSSQNAGNRWFDKTIQLIVNRNGVNGFCYEHSPAEGQPIAIMTDFIIKNLNDQKLAENSSKTDCPDPCELKMSVSDKLCEHIKKAKENVDKLASDLQLCVLHYRGYGREFIKTQKFSPDSYIQMAMQYAFYRLYKTPAAQYESAHLRLYPGGRTETIRSCSIESVAFTRAMIENCPDEERVKLLKTAVNEHRRYTQMAMQGKGIDRHLLGLKLMALENNLPIPKFYSTPGIAKSAHFRLSTSQVASKYPAFMCYGTLTNDGYGCCYNPRADDIYFAVSSWRSNKETDTNKFAVTLMESLDCMQDLLSRAGEKPKSKM